MKNVLVLGGGRSSPVLINYLIQHAASWDAAITVGDKDVTLASSRLVGDDRGHAISFNAEDEAMCRETIAASDLVISLLPPHLHILAARECLNSRKHLITASYVSKETEELNEEVKRSGLLFMYEMGLDPGIDHMSAMKIIHDIKRSGGQLTLFKSGTGGLVSPESDNNPWHYKVTWNPRNVVLAGQGTAQYLENGVRKFVPYHRLFATTEKFKLKELGKFESYPNRDSLQYISKYGLSSVRTIIRSTLRKSGYCKAWSALVQLGLTDDSYSIETSGHLSYADWLSSYLPEKKKHGNKTVKDLAARFFGSSVDDKMLSRLEWLGLFSDEIIPLEKATPARILQDLIERKWKMSADDNDMIVMRHEFEYSTAKTDGSSNRRRVSTMVHMGENATHTAMAKTVGLPMGIMAKLMLQGAVTLSGVHIPVMAEVYEPILKELESMGISFEDELDS